MCRFWTDSLHCECVDFGQIHYTVNVSILDRSTTLLNVSILDRSTTLWMCRFWTDPLHWMCRFWTDSLHCECVDFGQIHYTLNVSILDRFTTLWMFWISSSVVCVFSIWFEPFSDVCCIHVHNADSRSWGKSWEQILLRVLQSWFETGKKKDCFLGLNGIPKSKKAQKWRSNTTAMILDTKIGNDPSKSP